ncbi:chloride channel protein [Geofilum rubicundum JCM 15548]|uniref:Chloride channel protein n=1 Tax=Geofilum rubicundum JCM 15548 TaxID=1236989 RepID=A0A0E9LTZ0_9BACT|nr:chloride channel protein [Geofilum rubicundum]GAO28724.1 chloride channel protein [Geofilum rubicundum JCM 15548]
MIHPRKNWIPASVSTLFLYMFKWILICGLIGVLVGSASAFFLWGLDWATNWRESHVWIIALLPLGGLIIGLTYHYWGETVVKGNNQLLEEFHSPKKVIPLRMAPLVLFGTIATHLFGGSAGREGTAVQMGGAIADQFTKIFRLRPRDRKVLLSAGVSAGFASVFGTPLAGAIFALEVFVVGKVRYEGLLPVFLAAFVADWMCHAWGIPHTVYAIPFVPALTPLNLLMAIGVGILFGFTARSFSFLARYWTAIFKRLAAWPPLRPVIGGASLPWLSG